MPVLPLELVQRQPGDVERRRQVDADVRLLRRRQPQLGVQLGDWLGSRDPVEQRLGAHDARIREHSVDRGGDAVRLRRAKQRRQRLTQCT